MLVAITNSLRAHRDRDDRVENPGVLGSAVLLGVTGVVGYLVYREFADRPVAPGGGNLPPPPGPVGPVEPEEPEARVIEEFASPYLTAILSFDPTRNRPYVVTANVLSTGGGSESEFATEEEARDYAESVQWHYGTPRAPDDIFISVAPNEINSLGDRGSVWQSVTEGTFYIAVRSSTSGGWIGPYNGIDEADDALMNELNVGI